MFSAATGIVCALLVCLSLFYPFRKTIKSKINTLRIHCIGGSLLTLTVLIHINLKILNLSLSTGLITFAALVLVAVTGVLKRRFMKSKFYYYAHFSCACIFLLALAVHAVQQVINLLLM